MTPETQILIDSLKSEHLVVLMAKVIAQNGTIDKMIAGAKEFDKTIQQVLTKAVQVGMTERPDIGPIYGSALIIAAADRQADLGLTDEQFDIMAVSMGCVIHDPVNPLQYAKDNVGKKAVPIDS